MLQARRGNAAARRFVQRRCHPGKYIGMKLSAGEILVEEKRRMYSVAGARVGKLTLRQCRCCCRPRDAGGEIINEGNAGNYLGAAYRGDGVACRRSLTVKGIALQYIVILERRHYHLRRNVDVHVGHAEGGKIIVKANARARLVASGRGRNLRLGHNRCHDDRFTNI